MMANASLTEQSPMSVHPLVARLARTKRLPSREVEACRDDREAVLPVFIDILVRAADRSRLVDEEELALVYIVPLLGEFADPAALGPLVAFLRGDAEWALTSYQRSGRRSGGSSRPSPRSD